MTSSRIALILLALSAATACAQEGAVSRVHDPTIIRCGEFYYIFSTGAGLPIRKSKDLFTWESAGTVFDELPAWAKEAVPGVNWLWAPDISYWGGKYHLYYSVSTFGSNRSCIGLAVNETLDASSPNYKWQDQGKVIESRPGRDNWNAIDPHLVLDENNEPWLAFGSFWSGIKLRRLDAKTGKSSATDEKLHDLARRPSPGAIEAPCIVKKGDWYYLFVSFDYCCKGVNSTYRIMAGRSKDIRGPYVDRDGTAMLDGGATPVLESNGTIRGPGHNTVLMGPGGDWLVHHYYDAADNGRAKLQIRGLKWDEQAWPVAEKPIERRATGPAR